MKFNKAITSLDVTSLYKYSDLLSLLVNLRIIHADDTLAMVLEEIDLQEEPEDYYSIDRSDEDELYERWKDSMMENEE
jgi:hypothetical protein